MARSVELGDRSGRRWTLVERSAVVRLDEADARELFAELLLEPDGEAILRTTASAYGVLAEGLPEVVVERLVVAFARGDLLVVDASHRHGTELAPIGVHGFPSAEDWTEYVPISELLPPEPIAPAETRPTLLRLELGALGFADECVLLLPRPGSGRWHPWAALTTVARHLHENPGDTLVAVGHRESAEPDEHGRLRAAALVHFVMAERNAWVAIAAKWGRVRDTQEYLAYLRHARGWPLPTVPIHGDADGATAAAVLAFQRAYNVRSECTGAIFEDGVIGEQTLGALFDVARYELRQWLGLQRVDLDSWVWHDTARAAIDAGDGFKPYRTMPALPVQHRGRMLDLVIVPAEEIGKVDLGMGAAGVYDVAAIETLPLGGVVAPRTGMCVEIVLRDELGAAIGDAAYEVELPGGAIARGHLDARGEARLEDLVEGWCRVRFPDLPGGCEVLELGALADGGTS